MLEFVAKALEINGISFILLKGTARDRGKLVRYDLTCLYL